MIKTIHTTNNQINKTLRCATYIRVSTEEQHLEGLSLPAQKKALEDYAALHSLVIAGSYADEGISARKSMKYRKGLIKLLEDVKQDKYDMILVTKLDRWFRNIRDYNITEEILQAHGCCWKTILENYDSSTANGQMVINIMLSVNQAECDRTSERIKAVFEYKRSVGLAISGMEAPYGYTVINGKICKDPETCHIVEDAYRCYFSCYSIRKVLSYLRDTYNSKAPTANIVDRLFKNKKYCGCFQGKPDYCEPYITEQQFEQIQKAKRAKTYPTQKYTYIFSGLIPCPVCNYSFTGFLKKQNLRSGDVSYYPRYRCGNKFDRHPSACLTERKIEDYLLNHVFEELEVQKQSFITAAQKQKPSDQVFKIKAELQRLNNMYQKGRITEEFYDTEYTRLEEGLKAQEDNTKAVTERFCELSNRFSGDWLNLYKKLDNEHKRAFWKSSLAEIYVDAQTHKLSGFRFLI